MNNVMECDVIAIKKMDGDGHLKAYADIRVGGSLVIRGCPIIEGKNGVFVKMPSRLGRDGRWYDIVVPENEALKSHLAEQILKSFQEDADAA